MQKISQLEDPVSRIRRPYEAIIRVLTVVVAAAGGFIMFPKIFLSAETTKLAAIVLSTLGSIVGIVFGLLSYRTKREYRRGGE